MSTPTVSRPAAPAVPAQRGGRPRRRAMPKGVRLDPSARFGPVSGGIAYALGVLALAYLATEAHVPVSWVFYLLGLLSAAAVLRSLAGKHTVEAVAARWIAWAAAGGLIAWAVAAGTPWRLVWCLVLAGVTGAGGMTAFVAQRKKTEAAERLAEAARQERAAAAAAGDPRARVWKQRLARVVNWDNCTILAVEDWADGNGYTVEVDPGPGGAAWSDLSGVALKRLGSDARLQLGCELEVGPGVDQRLALIEVPTLDAFKGEQTADDDLSPRSVHHGLDWGGVRDGSRAILPLREESTAVVAMKGGGKTTALQRIVQQLARCTDGMVAIADMNAGALGKQWCEAWWDGKAPHPPVAWIAGDAVEALRLAKFTLGMALGRKRRSGPLKLAHNTSLMPVGNGAPGEPPPLWLTITDESAELVGADAALSGIAGMDVDQVRLLIQDVMATYEKVERVGRDAACVGMYTALRSTDDFLPTSLLAQCHNRVGFRMATDQDYANLFGWHNGGTDDAVGKGRGRFSFGHGQPTRVFQTPDVTPRQVYDWSIAIAEAGIGPYELSEEDIRDGDAAAGEGTWAGRWDRAAWMFGRQRIDYDTQQPVGPVIIEQGPATPKEAPAMNTADDGRSLAETMTDLDDMAAAAEAACREAEAGSREGLADHEVDARFAALAAEFDGPASAPAPAELPPWRGLVLQLLKDQAEPLGPSWLWRELKKRGYPTSRQTIQDYVRGESTDPGSPVQDLGGGKYTIRDA